MAGRPLSPAEVLDLIPQQRPFRFVDEIHEVDEQHIIGAYRFREDEFFYAGHFPGMPLTPAVILVEAMAQVGVTALGYYLLGLDAPMEDLRHIVAVFVDCKADFLAPVRPGDRVVIRAEKIFFRRGKLKAKVTLTLDTGTLAAEGELSGLGVAHASI